MAAHQFGELGDGLCEIRAIPKFDGHHEIIMKSVSHEACFGIREGGTPLFWQSWCTVTVFIGFSPWLYGTYLYLLFMIFIYFIVAL